MGFNTSLILLNDRMSALEGDPALGERVVEMVRDLSIEPERRRYRYGYRGLTAIHCAHADREQIVRIGRNRGEIVGSGSVLSPLLEAAASLYKTTDARERRRLIALIEKMGQIHDENPSQSSFWM